MDSISETIALAVGNTDESVIIAYKALIEAIKQVCGADSKVVEAITMLEQKSSRGRTFLLQEEVNEAKLDQNSEIVTLAKHLLEVIQGQRKSVQIHVKIRSVVNVGAIGDNSVDLPGRSMPLKPGPRMVCPNDSNHVRYLRSPKELPLHCPYCPDPKPVMQEVSKP